MRMLGPLHGRECSEPGALLGYLTILSLRRKKPSFDRHPTKIRRHGTHFLPCAARTWRQRALSPREQAHPRSGVTLLHERKAIDTAVSARAPDTGPRAILRTGVNACGTARRRVIGIPAHTVGRAARPGMAYLRLARGTVGTRPVIAGVGARCTTDLTLRVRARQRVVIVHLRATRAVIRRASFIRQIVHDRCVRSLRPRIEQRRLVQSYDTPEAVVPGPGTNSINRIYGAAVRPLSDTQERTPTLGTRARH